MNCGKLGHIAANCRAPQVPADKRPCFNCGKTGHQAAKCPAQKHNLGSLSQEETLVLSLDEEKEFRQTCQSWLGVSAETVEEVRDRSADSRRRGAGAVLGLPNLRTRTGKEMPHVS